MPLQFGDEWSTIIASKSAHSLQVRVFPVPYAIDLFGKNRYHVSCRHNMKTFSILPFVTEVRAFASARFLCRMLFGYIWHCFTSILYWSVPLNIHELSLKAAISIDLFV